MSDKVWAVLFDGVCAMELYEDKGAALKRYGALAKSGEIPHLQETVVHGGEVEQGLLCAVCCNVGTVPGKHSVLYGIPPRELCPVCVKEGRIKRIGHKAYYVAEGINHGAVRRVIDEWHREPKEPIDYSLAAGGDDGPRDDD